MITLQQMNSWWMQRHQNNNSFNTTQHHSNGSKRHFSALQLDHHVLKRNRSSLVSWNSGKGQRSRVKHGVSGGLCGSCVVLCADGSQSSGEYFTTAFAFFPALTLHLLWGQFAHLCLDLALWKRVCLAVLNVHVTCTSDLKCVCITFYYYR